MSVIRDELKTVLEDIARNEDMNDFVIISEDVDLKGDNYLGEIFRVNIVDVSKKEPLHILIKVSPKSLKSRKNMPINDFYQREVHAYKHIIPAFQQLLESSHTPEDEQFTVPTFFSGDAEEFKEFLVFKDMSCEGFEMLNRMIPLNYEQTKAVIKKLANLHACSFAMKENDPQCFSSLTEHVAQTVNFPENIINLFYNVRNTITLELDPVTREKFEEACSNMWLKFTTILDSSKTDPYNVICHGDCWTNNLLFKYEDKKILDCLFLDWQLIRLSSPVTDLAYFLFLNTDQAFRKEHFKKLMEVYYTTLCNHIHKMGCNPADCYPRNVFDQHQKDLMVFGLFFSLGALRFFLNKPGEEKSMDEAFECSDDVNYKMDLNDETTIRLKGVITDFVEFEFI